MNATYSLAEFFKVLDDIAPLELSRKMIEKGSYDNSGILVKTKNTVNGAIFSLDLTTAVINRAKSLGIDTIVTHHPAIYSPLKSIDIEGDTKDVALAVATNKNVISMHLNLDITDGGIDASMAENLGAKEYKILDYVDEKHGYGREFNIEKTTLSKFASAVKKNFNTKKVIYYGSKNAEIKSIASFCGAGGSHAVECVSKGLTSPDVIITSDIAHHEIKYLIEKGIALVILPHYASEEYGFRKFYENVNAKIGKDVKLYYYGDKRFR